MTDKDGGPAFPFHNPYSAETFKGMSLRAYIATAALQGILAAKFASMVANVPASARYDCAAADAVLMADALIAELAKERT